VLRFSPNGQGGRPYHDPSSSMRLLSWNCRWAGRPSTVRTLKAFARKEEPDVFFCCGIQSEVSKDRKAEKGHGFL
jgi:hypothetical protein